MFKRKLISVAVTAVTMGLPLSALAEGESAVTYDDEVIVTGVVAPTTKLSSTNSVTALGSEDIANFAPRSTAEIFRNLPGVSSEASSGDSNGNIKVRGIPISAGGSRYLSLQEDGLPQLLIGDLEFATSDSFLRSGYGLRSVQSIRGGAAATSAANSAGGIINFLSQTGEVEGGSVGITTGLDYDSNRIDFSYGAPIEDGLSFHVSGFAREGEGTRETANDIEDGQQLKFNITKDFEKGFARVFLKHLDDRSPTLLPIPARYDGNGNYSEIGVDFGDGSLYLDGSDVLNRNGGRELASLSTGFEAEWDSIGFEGEYDISDSTTLGLRHRTAWVSGQFVSPFPASVTDNGDGTSTVSIHYFNTKLDSLDNNFTDLFAKHDFGTVKAKAGVSIANQDYKAQWGWNQYDVTIGDGLDRAGWTRTPGHPIWGDCCSRSYDIEIENVAPYISLTGDVGDAITWDASVRHDMYDVDGSIRGSGAADADGYLTYGSAAKIDYDFEYTSAAFGLNYALSEESAVFGSISKGGSAVAPSRIIGGSGENLSSDGEFSDDEVAYTEVKQAEVGYKFRNQNTTFYVTAFYAETDERAAAEFTAGPGAVRDNKFETKGVEIEASYEFDNGFGLMGSVTLTDSEIKESEGSPENEGNTPRRQADYIFNATTYYKSADHYAGLNFIGTDEVYVSAANDATFDDYVITNLFYNYSITPSLLVSLNVNNVFDTEGFTEGEDGSAVAGDLVRVRPINGRTSSVSLRYDF